jgi:hypothetical protein
MKKLQGVVALLGLLVLTQPANSAELKIFGSRVTKVIVGELGRNSRRRPATRPSWSPTSPR